MLPVDPQPLGSANYGQFAISHPGQFAVADIGLSDGQQFTAVSLYGIWDRDARWIYAEATFHRAISDLTVLFQDRGRTEIVVAGDLNIGLGWDRAKGTEGAWAPRYNTVRDRLAAYGLSLAGPFGDRPQERCDCGAGSECRHVRTFAYHRNPANGPTQPDYVFVTDGLKPAECRVLDDEAAWRYSDHLPVITKVTLG